VTFFRASAHARRDTQTIEATAREPGPGLPLAALAWAIALLRGRFGLAGFDTTLVAEWSWVIGRLGITLTTVIGFHLFLRDSTAYEAILVMLALVNVYNIGIAALLLAKRLRTAFIAGVICDNTALVVGWWVAATGTPSSLTVTDLYLILFPVLTIGAARFGWLFGFLYTAFWVLWLVWTTFLVASPGSYALEQLSLRMLFAAITAGLVLRLVSRLTGEKGRAERASAQYRELSEKLEAVVAERTAQLEATNKQLEATNKELESFTYSVSHDLRNPLWVIDGMSEMLAQEYGGTLGRSGMHYIGLVRSSAQRSMAIVKSLLEMSRAERHVISRRRVDLGAMAAEIIEELRLSDPDRAVETAISTGGPMVVERDPDLLRIVLDNLLRNAWKYSQKRPVTRMELGWRAQDGSTVFYVRDNGAGFDMADAGKLFRAFERLHSREEFEGTGVGLATVQRIIQRHGGRIWAEGAVDQGATFYFTLPAQE
jgi:signal transduction histidine kinase